MGPPESVMIRPLARKVAGEPTVMTTFWLQVPPFMSLTVQRTVYSPGPLQLLVALSELGPKVSSPKSHQQAKASPSASLASALKFTAEFTPTLVRSAVILATGGVLVGKLPKLTTTSIQFSGAVLP